jgi:anti-sigma-K factor RskA
VNRLPTSPDDFDRQLAQLQRQADGALSPATLARLRDARRQAGASAGADSPWRRRGWWLATACSAVLAVTAAMQFSRTPPPTAPLMADEATDTTDDTLLFDQSPELYLWLGSDALAME